MAEAFTTPSVREGNFTGRGKFSRFSSRTGKCSKSARTPWLSRRHTPYVKTPKTGRTSRSHPETEVRENVRSRKTSEIERIVSSPEIPKISTDSALRSGQNDEQTKDPVQDIVGKTLRVYQTSPLYNFDRQDTTALKTYAEQLSGFLQLDTEKQLLIEENGDIKNRKFKANVSVFKDLTADGAKFSAVKIIVHNVTSKPTQTSSITTPVLTTVFCSVGGEEELEEDTRLQDHFTCLPICLINGPVIIARSLINWFESRFDCRITPMTFSSVDLGWYFSLWAGMTSPGKSTPVELCYDTSSVNGLSRILFSIDGKDAKDLWENVHSNNSLIFTEEESTNFLKALESHFYHHFRINLEGLPLTRVRTAIAYIASEGKLKIVHPRYADHILEQLTRAALTKEFYGRL